MTTIRNETLRRQAEQAVTRTAQQPALVIVDEQTQARFERAQTQLATTPLDPNALPAGPRPVPFYQRRWFWVVAGAGTFALIYSLRRQD